MKLLTKNGYKFATGLFWQVPDENKRVINYAKLKRDTKHDMYCQVSQIKSTWGFCQKEGLQREKKVAALGQFIVEASNLTVDYANSIICYKFKNVGDLDETGKELKIDLYGYIVLLNGTICPDDGEYVSEFAAVSESIVTKAKKHEIETLYLPFDVSGKFFSIFERLFDALHSDELLSIIIQNLTIVDRKLLNTALDMQFDAKYKQLFTDEAKTTNLALLKQLIKESEFEKIVKETRNLTIKYLMPNVYHLPYTSDQIYWQHPKFKQRFKRALLKPLIDIKIRRAKELLMLTILAATVYIAYLYFFVTQPLLPRNSAVMMAALHPISVDPAALINACIGKNDQYFNTDGVWQLISLKCDSNKAVLTFNAYTESTLDAFINFTHDVTHSKLSGKIGTLQQNYHLFGGKRLARAPTKNQTISNLQQGVINYKLNLNVNAFAKHALSDFVLNSQLSPVFLFTHGVLNNVRLREINMTLNKNTGFYTWSLRGEIEE